MAYILWLSCGVGFSVDTKSMFDFCIESEQESFVFDNYIIHILQYDRNGKVGNNHSSYNYGGCLAYKQALGVTYVL